MRLNKKGDNALLPEETLKIIVAVICIIVLVGVVTLIYFAVTGNQSIKYAKEIVNGNHGIGEEIKRISAVGGEKTEFPVPNPSGWYIFTFVGSVKKPNSCAGVNCLCVCEKLLVGIVNSDERQAGRCDDKGSCVVVLNLKSFEPIEIKKGGIFVSIKETDGLINIERK